MGLLQQNRPDPAVRGSRRGRPLAENNRFISESGPATSRPVQNLAQRAINEWSGGRGRSCFASHLQRSRTFFRPRICFSRSSERPRGTQRTLTMRASAFAASFRAGRVACGSCGSEGFGLYILGYYSLAVLAYFSRSPHIDLICALRGVRRLKRSELAALAAGEIADTCRHPEALRPQFAVAVGRARHPGAALLSVTKGQKSFDEH